ncbi:hypothetical protein BS50DRAFT_645821 [Corynespora cassiicola Philippines]|uniref:Uncharacterized protein n=1 Tax=Corynespora cassiicola Philippines TaxID=1448308 RepID=A0A2T2NKH5_CORCC|nr:hypothetical protein BS50DRAFT_645821 [Corynespora cassiicola Philippines]
MTAYFPRRVDFFVARQIVSNLSDDVLSAARLCLAYPNMVDVVGHQLFSEYQASKPGDLSQFLSAIIECPDLAPHVKKIHLCIDYDSPLNSGLYGWLIEIANGHYVSTQSDLHLRSRQFLHKADGKWPKHWPVKNHLKLVRGFMRRHLHHVEEVKCPSAWEKDFQVRITFAPTFKGIITY